MSPDPAVLCRFAANLRRARVKRGLTAGELAKRVGISRSWSVYGWERGGHLPRLDVARKLATVLGVSLDDLVSGEVLRD